MRLQLPDSYHSFINGILDAKTLRRTCGISWIIDQYTRTRSPEVRHTLFLVIFYYGVDHFRSWDRASISECLRVLTQIDAPLMFPSLFKFTPPKFTKSVIEFIEKSGYGGKADRALLKQILRYFHKLAGGHTKVCEICVISIYALTSIPLAG